MKTFVLCYRIEAVGDEFEFICVRYLGKIYRVALKSRSENFHKRFHRFSLRRWMSFGTIISELPNQSINYIHLNYTEIDSRDLAEIMKIWGYNIDPDKFEDI